MSERVVTVLPSGVLRTRAVNVRAGDHVGRLAHGPFRRVTEVARVDHGSKTLLRTATGAMRLAHATVVYVEPNGARPA